MIEEIPHPRRKEPIDLHVIQHRLQPMLQHQERSVTMHVDCPSFILAADKVPGVQWQQLAGAVGVDVCIYGFESREDEPFDDGGSYPDGFLAYEDGVDIYC